MESASFILHDEKTWPLDNPEEVSVGRLVELAGKSKFGEAWTELVKAAATPLFEPLPDLKYASRLDLEIAWSLLPESKTRKAPTVTSSGITKIWLGPLEWQRAGDVIQKKNAPRYEALDQISAIILRIRDECLHGRLRAYAQIYNGTTFPIGSHLWKTERFRRWFETGRASMLEVLDQPFSSDDPTMWVFFSRVETDKAFPQSTNTERRDGPTIYGERAVEDWLSSYWMQFCEGTLQTFSDGKQLAYPRFEKDFTPAITAAFPNISTGIIRRSWDNRPEGTRRVRD